jgi:hypothetical protein
MHPCWRAQGLYRHGPQPEGFCRRRLHRGADRRHHDHAGCPSPPPLNASTWTRTASSPSFLINAPRRPKRARRKRDRLMLFAEASCTQFAISWPPGRSTRRRRSLRARGRAGRRLASMVGNLTTGKKKNTPNMRRTFSSSSAGGRA